jgi:membrane-bound inhibitor of C-type lysozyme
VVGPIALTRAACPPGSFSDRFAREVGRATSYFVKDGELFLELPVDSGTLRFIAAANAAEAPKPVAFRCPGLESTPVSVVYRNDTQPPSALVTIGDRRAAAFAVRTASGARYASNEIDFWEHQGQVTLTWDGKTYTCAVR